MQVRLDPRGRRLLLRGLAVAAALVAVVGWWVLSVPFPQHLLQPHTITSTLILDRDGHRLREVYGEGDGRARWLGLDEVSPHLLAATVHAEDKRFEAHHGVDPVAVARAAWLNLTQGRVVSGASTLTQQTVKLTMPELPRRTLYGKALEALWAVRLEHSADKDTILAQYLNRAPYGNQLFGAEAAAQSYFGKPARDLSLAEAALLAGLPQAPSVTEPRRHLQRARDRQRVILHLMRSRDAIDEATYRQALAEPIRLRPRQGEVLAHHFTDHILGGLVPDAPRPGELRTTLDARLQKKVEGIVNLQLERIEDRGVDQAAVVVLDTVTGEVLAWVGSRDHDDFARLGANDGVTALRQPGSTLKPFVYGLRLERGGTGADLLADLPLQFNTPQGAYIPHNYDQRHRGPVSLRDALGSSLNIPAVAVAMEVGVDKLLARLRLAGFASLDGDAQLYGPGLALGNGEVRLLELASAYAALGRLGQWQPVRTLRSIDGQPAPRDQTRREIFSPEVSYQLLDILSDDQAREQGFGRHGPLALPYRVAAKTGTSTNFRDNWAVGVTPAHTVAVWVGNFDGRPMEEVSGVTGAAPIMRHVFQALYPEAAGPADVPWPRAPRSLHTVNVCALSGHPASPDCPATRKALLPDARQGASGRASIGGDFAHGPEVCQIHRAVLIDRRTGMLAGPGCDPLHTERRVFHQLPAELVEWGVHHDMTPPPMGFSPLCPGPEGGLQPAPDAQVQIVHPLPGDVFQLDPHTPEVGRTITLRAASTLAHQGVPLTWFIDGRPLTTLPAPYTARWSPGPGQHRVGLGRGDRPEVEVTVTVR